LVALLHRFGLEYHKPAVIGRKLDIYPRLEPRPIEQDALLTGPLEPTNEWYAVAKIAGLKMCQAYRRQYVCDFVPAMPTNLYGPGDNYDINTSHVLSAMIRKMHDAKTAKAVLREFLHVDDCADALVFIMKAYSEEQHINAGSGSEISILELAKPTARAVGFEGNIVHDLSEPDGTPRKVMDSAKLRSLRRQPKIGLEESIRGRL
jgi:GDP-L-fucose synthase